MKPQGLMDSIQKLMQCEITELSFIWTFQQENYTFVKLCRVTQPIWKRKVLGLKNTIKILYKNTLKWRIQWTALASEPYKYLKSWEIGLKAFRFTNGRLPWNKDKGKIPAQLLNICKDTIFVLHLNRHIFNNLFIPSHHSVLCASIHL